MFFVFNISKGILLILGLLISVAFYTLAERHVLASMQKRRGPNIVGFEGLLQPLADGLKLLTKENIIPANVDFFVFVLAPIITFVFSMLRWAVIPFCSDSFFISLELGLLFLMAVSSLGVYGIILGGWASNSKYAFLGALRSVAQMISYEISLSIVIATLVICVGSLDLFEYIKVQRHYSLILPMFPLFIIFAVSILAESNRAPFDLPEAEGELVAGYNVEYSGFSFALFFLGEYANMLLMSILLVLLFLGNFISGLLDDLFVILIQVLFVAYYFIWARATLPRYRYDQLMFLGWKIFLPIALTWFFFVGVLFYVFNVLPPANSTDLFYATGKNIIF